RITFNRDRRVVRQRLQHRQQSRLDVASPEPGRGRAFVGRTGGVRVIGKECERTDFGGSEDAIVLFVGRLVEPIVRGEIADSRFTWQGRSDRYVGPPGWQIDDEGRAGSSG